MKLRLALIFVLSQLSVSNAFASDSVETTSLRYLEAICINYVGNTKGLVKQLKSEGFIKRSASADNTVFVKSRYAVIYNTTQCTLAIIGARRHEIFLLAPKRLKLKYAGDKQIRVGGETFVSHSYTTTQNILIELVEPIVDPYNITTIVVTKK